MLKQAKHSASLGHESVSRRAEEIKSSSNRSFGLVFTACFTVIGLWPLLHDAPVRLWSLGIAAGFLAVSLLYPALLGPMNRLWTRFGLLLHKVVNPVIMAAMFFIAVVPTGLIMRALGKDPLRLKWDPEATSYWIKREPPGPPPASMSQQF